MSQQSTLRPARLSPCPPSNRSRLVLTERSTESAPPPFRFSSAFSSDNPLSKRLPASTLIPKPLPATPSGPSPTEPSTVAAAETYRESSPAVLADLAKVENKPSTVPTFSSLPAVTKNVALNVSPPTPDNQLVEVSSVPCSPSTQPIPDTPVLRATINLDSVHRDSLTGKATPIANYTETQSPRAGYISGASYHQTQSPSAPIGPHSPRASLVQRPASRASPYQRDTNDRSPGSNHAHFARSPRVSPRLVKLESGETIYPYSTSVRLSLGVTNQEKNVDSRDLGFSQPQPVTVEHNRSESSPGYYVVRERCDPEPTATISVYPYADPKDERDYEPEDGAHSHLPGSAYHTQTDQSHVEVKSETTPTEHAHYQHSNSSEAHIYPKQEDPPSGFSSGVSQLRLRNTSQGLVAQAYSSPSASLLSAQLTSTSHGNSPLYLHSQHYPETLSLPRSSSSVASLLSHPITLPPRSLGHKSQAAGQYISSATSSSTGHYENIPGHLLPREDVEVFFDHLDSSRQQVMALESSNNSTNSGGSGGGGGGSGGSSGTRHILSSALTGSGGHYVVSSESEGLSYTHLANAGGGIPPGQFMYYGGGASSGGGAVGGAGEGYKSRLLSLQPPTYSDHPGTYLPTMPSLFSASSRSGRAGAGELDSIYHSAGSNGLSHHHHHPASPHAPQGAVLVGDGQDMWATSGHAQSGEVVYTNLTGATLHTPADSLMKYEYHPHYPLHSSSSSSTSALHQGSSLSSNGSTSQGSLPLGPASSRTESVLSRQLSRPPNCLDGGYSGRMLSGAATLSSAGGEGAAVLGSYHGQDAMMQAWNYSQAMSEGQILNGGVSVKCQWCVSGVSVMCQWCVSDVSVVCR